MQREELLARIARGEDETLELKTGVPTVHVIANQLASFANASGGSLVLGVKEPNYVVGVNPARAKSAVNDARRYLSPSIDVEVELHDFEGRSVVVASVPSSERLISTRGGYYRRIGTHTRPLTAKEIVDHAKRSGSSGAALKELSGVVAEQTTTINALREDFNRVNSHPRKIGIALLGAVVGVVGKYLIEHFL